MVGIGIATDASESFRADPTRMLVYWGRFRAWSSQFLTSRPAAYRSRTGAEAATESIDQACDGSPRLGGIEQKRLDRLVSRLAGSIEFVES
jgi:hypothetical protein